MLEISSPLYSITIINNECWNLCAYKTNVHHTTVSTNHLQSYSANHRLIPSQHHIWSPPVSSIPIPPDTWIQTSFTSNQKNRVPIRNNVVEILKSVDTGELTDWLSRRTTEKGSKEGTVERRTFWLGKSWARRSDRCVVAGRYSNALLNYPEAFNLPAPTHTPRYAPSRCNESQPNQP